MWRKDFFKKNVDNSLKFQYFFVSEKKQTKNNLTSNFCECTQRQNSVNVSITSLSTEPLRGHGEKKLKTFYVRR